MFGYAKGATSSLESVYLIVLASFVFFFKKNLFFLHCIVLTPLSKATYHKYEFNSNLGETMI